MLGRPGFIIHCQHLKWNPLLNVVYLADVSASLKKKKCVRVCVCVCRVEEKKFVVPPTEM